MKVKVWYKDGTSVDVEPIDAMELLASKDYSNENPKETKKAKK